MRTEKQFANLEKGKFRTSESGREAGRKGGVESGKTRRTIKDIREWAEQNLFATNEDRKSNYEMCFDVMKKLVKKGNLKAVEMFLNYSGLKPVEKQEIDIDLTFKKFLDEVK